MEKKKLSQYRSLKKELELIDEKLEKLYERQENVPDVMGKVTGSSKDFPYTQVRTTVRMAEPEINDSIKRLIKIKEKRQQDVMRGLEEIETYIAEIKDSETRRIFELIYIDGKKQREVAEEVNLDRSRVSRKISDYLKTHTKHKKDML